ncbi:hypothetical protein FRB90_011068 [Tulasnella sp. 427]|nr:hypothetical protein FRB90_011068 [Tulasnella sp. 427]
MFATSSPAHLVPPSNESSVCNSGLWATYSPFGPALVPPAPLGSGSVGTVWVAPFVDSKPWGLQHGPRSRIPWANRFLSHEERISQAADALHHLEEANSHENGSPKPHRVHVPLPPPPCPRPLHFQEQSLTEKERTDRKGSFHPPHSSLEDLYATLPIAVKLIRPRLKRYLSSSSEEGRYLARLKRELVIWGSISKAPKSWHLSPWIAKESRFATLGSMDQSRRDPEWYENIIRSEGRLAHVELIIKLIEERDTLDSHFWGEVNAWQIKEYQQSCEEFRQTYKRATSTIAHKDKNVKLITAALDKATERAYLLQPSEKPTWEDAFVVRSIYDDPDLKALIESNRIPAERRRRMLEAAEEMALQQPLFPPECYALLSHSH